MLVPHSCEDRPFLTRSPPRAGRNKFKESPHRLAKKQRLYEIGVPVAKIKSFRRQEVSKGDATAIKIASRIKLMSALVSALDIFSRSTR